MIIPMIQPNGTVDLMAKLFHVQHSLCVAYDALRIACPDGRDYYPQGTDNYKAALAEHLDRLRRIGSVKDEIDSLIQAIHAKGENQEG